MMVPRSKEDGRYHESVAIFAARRCRTPKSYDELWVEVNGYSDEKRINFLQKVVTEDWAADVLEMIPMTFDWEGVPVWLVIELLRHRLVAREFSLEQLSQRAISPLKLKVEIPNGELQELADEYIEKIKQIIESGRIPPEDAREAFPQGVLVNLCISGNLRAFHHFFFMRSSELFQGKGGAHRKFMDLADQMQVRALDRLPVTMKTILRA